MELAFARESVKTLKERDVYMYIHPTLAREKRRDM
jgi:hypothetical protein